MPEPDHAPTRDERSRRQVLGVAGGALSLAAVAALTGCRVRLEQEPLRTPPPLTDDELARDRAAEEAEDLLDLLDEVRTLRPDASALLGRIATDHQAHLSALRLPPSTTTPSPKPTATATGTATGTATATPTLSRTSALTFLAQRETAAGERLRGALGPVSGDLARLLAGIAASRACHADALTALESS